MGARSRGWRAWRRSAYVRWCSAAQRRERRTTASAISRTNCKASEATAASANTHWRLASESENPGLTLLYRQINALNPARRRGMLGRPPPAYRGSTHALIAGLGVPVLYLVGEHDLITSPEMIREARGLIPGAAFHQVDAAGHSCYFERATEWNRVVGEFLARVDG
ncbi:MAG: alpha/beta hydrolase [Dehalococcoidia bacterium]|nr:alpha/beta hydrolase [Dehalococcoidia bacterium]